MGIKRILTNITIDMHHHAVKRAKMESILPSEYYPTFFEELELHNSPMSFASEDIWKKFDLPTPPLSPSHDGDDGWDLENVDMPFDIDTEDLVLFDDEKTAELLKDVEESFPESPPGPDLDIIMTSENLASNLIQDIMWSAPSSRNDGIISKKSTTESTRQRCNSCSAPPTDTKCVAPDEVLMETTMTGQVAKTSFHNHGIETPSDSEEEIDVVTVADKQFSTFPVKKKCTSEDEWSSPEMCKTKPPTVTFENKPVQVHHIVTKYSNTSVRQRVDCPTDVHNYSLPVTSLKRVHSYPSSPVTHKSKKIRRDISIPSELRKVAQKLKSSVGSCSRNSSDSEDMCDAGKRTQHNVLERKRRTDLKNSFFHLRDSVPDLEGQERAAKVVILRNASQYIIRLIEEQRQKEREIEQLKLKKEKLKRHLSRLRDY
ncbi:myc protein-like [Dreissena polymorpha]|uniref:BHLH domain-containing protein n=1 Tax=Dreissena polymorpha TaxID=45954 RepID=A0A9D4M0I1_DREPO|nr:myc protein-like [Dreissena polymorpha]KAH3867379.1 hypothetical protein DPMN_030505 [Dreissena polymorpha]